MKNNNNNKFLHKCCVLKAVRILHSVNIISFRLAASLLIEMLSMTHMYVFLLLFFFFVFFVVFFFVFFFFVVVVFLFCFFLLFFFLFFF